MRDDCDYVPNGLWAGAICVIATVLMAVAGFTAMVPGPRSVVGTRARGELAPRARRPSGDLPCVPTPADPATEPQTIRIVVETAEETSPPRRADTTLSAVVYGATWCPTCSLVNPAIIEAKKRGYVVEYRDLDEHPTPHVTVVPAVFIYRDDVAIYTTSGFLNVTDALREYLP